MQKIRTIAFVINMIGINALTLPALAAPIMVDSVGIEECFNEAERLSRLTCYDLLLDRDEITDTQNEIEGITNITPLIPAALIFAEKLITAPDRTEENVRVTLIERANSVILHGSGENGVFDLIDTSIPQDAFDIMRADNDLYLALPSQKDIGEQAVLSASCQNNITRLKVYFDVPFSGKTQKARFYGGKTLINDGSEARHVWVRGDGYVLENARGLDAIRLLSQLSQGQLGQISVGTGEDVRSAFFDTDALRAALPMLQRHCSWSFP